MTAVEQEVGREAGRSVAEAMEAFATESLLLFRPDGEVVWASHGFRARLGIQADELSGGHIAKRVHPDDLLRVLSVLDEARTSAPGFARSLAVRVRHVDGQLHAFDAEVVDARDDPALAGFVVRLWPVQADTARDGAGAGSDRSRAPVTSPPPAAIGGTGSFRSLAHAVPSGILAADGLGQVVFANEAALDLLDVPLSELRGRAWRHVVDPRDRPDVAAAAGGVLAASAKEQTTFRVHAGSGLRWVHATFVPLEEDARRTGWIATLEDVTERRLEQAELAHRASHDELTGLPNRMLLFDRLAQASARLRRQRQPMTVLFVDLDAFKDVNDRFGHGCGDEVLVETGRRLHQAVRPADTVARIGGDEFVAVCEGMDAAEADALVGRIHQVVGVPIVVDGHAVRVGVSVGVVCTADHQVGPDELLSRADQAMYREKRAASA